MAAHETEPTPGERLDQAFRDGDYKTVLGIALRARHQAGMGNYCQCPEPQHGHPADARPVRGEVTLMCDACGLEDQALKARVEEYMRSSHPWEEYPGSFDVERSFGWCYVCSHPRDDPRHAEDRT